MRWVWVVLALHGLALGQGSILFLSTQLRPLEEAQKMRQIILKDFPGRVEFLPEETAIFTDRVLAENRAGRITVSLLGGLHGDFPPLLKAQALDPVDDVLGRLQGRRFPKTFLELAKLGTNQTYYVPWMQATYIMVAHREALRYLPPRADLNTLTYSQLQEWAANVQRATGRRLLGFPAGPRGLLHRFFQGYLYPSFTGSAVTRYRSPEAERMWREFRELWRFVAPQSTAYDFMQEPLLAGEVWIAWDHTARLLDALRQRPQDFVVFPAPIGPKGRGFMPVLAGLAVPKGAPNREGASALIEYLTRPTVQITTLREVGFFPVVEVSLPQDLPPGIRRVAEAIQRQASGSAALPSLLPVGLGAKGGEFNKVYLDTFSRIVLRGEDIRRVLDQEADNLKRILQETGAPCWAPDPPSAGPCPVE